MILEDIRLSSQMMSRQEDYALISILFDSMTEQRSSSLSDFRRILGIPDDTNDLCI
jgi:hypothetical protein